MSLYGANLQDNMEKTDRIKRLIALRRLGMLTDDELSELNILLRDMPAFRSVHDRVMNNRDIIDSYAVFRSSKHPQAFDLLLERKGMKRASRRSLMTVLRYCAVILLPVALFVGYLLLKDGEEKDLYPKPFVATLKSPGSEKHTLAVAAVESYSVRKLNSIPARKERLADDLYVLSTSSADEFRVTLEDGTVVHLNHDSELYFPEHFETHERRVLLRGEAYVKVAKDVRPFLIVTDAATIKQYGTSFNVKAYDEYRTEVVLVEGSVGVIPHDASATDSPVMMKPGQMCMLSGAENLTLKDVDPTPYIAWETGRFNFEDYPLVKIMEVLRKWYGVDYVFRDPKLSELRFSGDIDRYGSIAPVLKAISDVSGVEVKLVGREVVIGD